MRKVVGFGVLCTMVVTWLLVNANSLEPDRFGRVGFAVVLAVPAALAVASMVHRPVLLIPAAVLSITLSGLLWSGLPLLFLPGLGYIWAYARSTKTNVRGLRLAVAGIAPVAVTVAAVRFLLSDTAERCVSTPNESVCTSAPPTSHVWLAIALAVAAVSAGWFLAAPRARDRVHPLPESAAG